MVDDDLSLVAKIIVSTAIEYHFADGLFGGIGSCGKRFIALLQSYHQRKR